MVEHANPEEVKKKLLHANFSNGILKTILHKSRAFNLQKEWQLANSVSNGNSHYCLSSPIIDVDIVFKEFHDVKENGTISLEHLEDAKPLFRVCIQPWDIYGTIHAFKVTEDPPLFL